MEQPTGEKINLKDILEYQADTYLDEGELYLIRSLFRDNPKVFKILRKVFMPTINDPELPIEQMGLDVWMSGRSWDQIPADEAKILVVARQEAMKFIFGGLVSLKNLTYSTDEDPKNRAARRAKDSSK